MIGRTIGSYTLVEKVGQGGMGEVYLAEHRRMGRRAAIKFLLPALTQDADVVTRFFNEARATSLIRHPGIVEIYDCDVIDEKAYIVMEYLEGESLGTALRRTGALAPEPATIAAVVGQIASALAAAHRKGIVHRDLKPENIFLSVEESSRAPFVVKILDFGIAKLVSPEGGGSNTRTGGLLGTPIYMSPEQCRGLSTIDRRADIYALGCVMFEMATGRHVFVKEASGDLLVAHIIETPPRVSSIRPEIPGWMDELVARMLAKGPDDRPASMDEIVSAMEVFLRVGASEFGAKISPTGALGRVPMARKHSTAPIVLAATATPPASTAPPARSVAPPDVRSARKIGGTQILPDGGLPPERPPNESTFRRTASELTLDPPAGRPSPKRSRPALAVAVGGLVIAGVAAVFLTQNKPASHRPPAVGDPEAIVPSPPAPAPTLAAEPVPAARSPQEEAPPRPPAKTTIRIVSRPAGAELWLGDESTPRGQTPLDLVVPRNATGLRATLKRDGYEEGHVSIDPTHPGPLQVELEKIKTAHHHTPPTQTHHPKHEAQTTTPKPGEGFFGVGD